VAIFDNHFHLRPSGLGVAAARQFEKAGGTALLLTHAPYEEAPVRSGEDYAHAYQITLDLAEAVRRGTGLQVFVALGPYPVELVWLAETAGVDRAERALAQGLDLAADHVREQRAIALGEVGRPHFPVSPGLWAASNRILRRAMDIAGDLGCAVVVHSEDPTAETFREFAEMADRAGLARHKVVKHHSSPITNPALTHGIVPSLLAKGDLVKPAVAGGGPFLLETDYIDDPKRPGAVLGPATVPRNTKRWLEAGLLRETQVRMIHRDLPERTYGIRFA